MSDRQVVLVTGASVGLGLAIARRLLHEQSKQNLHLVLTARAGSLHRFGEQGIVERDDVWIRALDITDAEQRVCIVNEIASTLGGVDVLINNAGVAYRSCVEHVTEPERLHQMNINFRSPIELTRCVLPGMRQKRRGKIINISSVGGMMAMPTMSVYSASKFALEGASEAMYYEVKPWNVSVTLVQPGFMRSDAFEKVPYTTLSAPLPRALSSHGTIHCQGNASSARHARFGRAESHPSDAAEVSTAESLRKSRRGLVFGPAACPAETFLQLVPVPQPSPRATVGKTLTVDRLDGEFATARTPDFVPRAVEPSRGLRCFASCWR